MATIDRDRRNFLSGRSAPGGARAAIDIASAVLHCRPARLAAVRAALAGLDGVELHAESETGRLVVTIEATPESGVAESLTRLHNLDGVIAVALVYQHSEDEEPQQ